MVQTVNHTPHFLTTYLLIFFLPVATGNCWTAASNTDGAAVTLQKCNGLGNAAQSWTFSAGAPDGEGAGTVGTITIFGNKCLDVTNGVNQSGTKLQIFGCSTANKNQQWQLIDQGDNIAQSVQWVGSTRCVDLTGGVQANGTPVRLLGTTFRVKSANGFYSYKSGPANRITPIRNGSTNT